MRVTEQLPTLGAGLQFALSSGMTAEALVQLMEEMVDIKIHLLAQSSMKLSPEVARLLHDKRDTDRQRLEQIRTEMIRILKG
jgi:hypothetical protein